MIRRVAFALIVGGAIAPGASAQSAPPSMPPAAPSTNPPVYATPQSAPPKAAQADVPPPPPRPVEPARPREQVASAEEAKRAITRARPLPRRASTFQQTNEYARREALMGRGVYANPGGVGREREYYTANTPTSQANLHPTPVGGFARGGGPDRYEQIAAARAGQIRARNIQDNINAYGRPYGAYGAGFGYGLGLGFGRGYGYPY